ncbi:MAG: hypothetical protein NTW29_12585 [Bacteroidetes bacterium]|nr:hypothetical protein [Bacteroidota bacterium]
MENQQPQYVGYPPCEENWPAAEKNSPIADGADQAKDGAYFRTDTLSPSPIKTACPSTNTNSQ